MRTGRNELRGSGTDDGLPDWNDPFPAAPRPCSAARKTGDVAGCSSTHESGEVNESWKHLGKSEMNCEQVEAIVLDLDRDDAVDSLERAAAVAHLSHCSRCAALTGVLAGGEGRVAGAGRRDAGSACACSCRDAAAAGVSHAASHDWWCGVEPSWRHGPWLPRRFLWVR